MKIITKYEEIRKEKRKKKERKGKVVMYVRMR
jgi:hypothetical protein